MKNPPDSLSVNKHRGSNPLVSLHKSRSKEPLFGDSPPENGQNNFPLIKITQLHIIGTYDLLGGEFMDYSVYPRNDVLCIDMRSFYASVEAVRLGLDPMKVMLAVVGDPNRRGSIVLAASPTLKKRYGISNVSRYFELPDDPNINIVPAHMGDYLKHAIEIIRL